MSERERALTRLYWQSIGGTLIEEFQVVDRSATSAPRRLDGLIVPDGPFTIARKRDVTVKDRHVIVVQTKPHRLDLPLLGQTLFGAELLRRRFEPASVRAVALCTAHDEALEEVVAQMAEIEVVVLDPRRGLAAPLSPSEADRSPIDERAEDDADTTLRAAPPDTRMPHDFPRGPRPALSGLAALLERAPTLDTRSWGTPEESEAEDEAIMSELSSLRREANAELA